MISQEVFKLMDREVDVRPSLISGGTNLSHQVDGRVEGVQVIGEQAGEKGIATHGAIDLFEGGEEVKKFCVRQCALES
jgi:hypothetical protein